MIGDPKKVAIGLIAKLHPKDEGEEPHHDMDDHGAGLHEVAKELIDAVHSGDAEGVVHAFHAMFQMYEQMPHEESPHEEEESEEME